MTDDEYREHLREVFEDVTTERGIVTQRQLAGAVLDVLGREVGPHLPMGVCFELDIQTREPGTCFVDIGLLPEMPKSRWKRLMQRIGLWFMRRAEEGR